MMAEYIEREALKAVFEEDGHLSAYVEEMIDSIPAADVRPVITCGKCKHWFENGTDYCSCDRDALLRERFLLRGGGKEGGKLMYEELIDALRRLSDWSIMDFEDNLSYANQIAKEAADAIEELQATLCNWCAVCPEDKRDLSTCEIYESCRAKPPKEE